MRSDESRCRTRAEAIRSWTGCTEFTLARPAESGGTHVAKKDSDDSMLRDHLRRLLDWEDAHASFDAAVEGIPPAVRGVAPEGLPYSPWQLVEHLRRTQRDILNFCRDPDYIEPVFPDYYWPPSATPPKEDAWEESV